MSLDVIKSVIREFIKSKSPEVLAISGGWGIGKTFFWKKFIKEEADSIALDRHCYVSLFGLTSINDVNAAIISKTVLSEEKANGSRWTLFLAWLERIFRRSSPLAKIIDGLPYAKNVSIGMEIIFPYLIRDTLICFDDLERLSEKGLSVEDFLGFVSLLKEERGCKVVIIFNEKKMASSLVYKQYKEKVVDIDISFSISPLEAANMVFPIDLQMRSYALEQANALHITNIRVLKKIYRTLDLVLPKLNGLNENVVKQAISTIVLMTWCHYDSSVDLESKRPSYAFIDSYNSISWALMASEEKEKIDPTESSWRNVLEAYGFQSLDEFDRTLCKIIENGYVEGSGLYEEASKLNVDFNRMDLSNSFSAAWRLFHDTFKNNQDEFIGALERSFKSSVLHISPVNLQGTVSILRELNRPDLAGALLDYYIDSHSQTNYSFDLSYEHGEITDPEIVERFQEKNKKVRQLPTLAESINVTTDGSWSGKHIHVMSSATVDDYYQFFMSLDGIKVSPLVHTCLRFERIHGDQKANDEYKEIAKKARQALERIARESLIGQVRARRYDIEI